MTDFIFLILPLIVGGILAYFNTKSVAESCASLQKWLGAQINFLKNKNGIGYRYILQPIVLGVIYILSKIATVNNQQLRSGLAVSFLIYLFLTVTLILGVAIYFFIYTIILCTLLYFTLWLLNKAGVLNKFFNRDFKNIQPLPSATVLDLNKAEDIKQMEDDYLIEIDKPDESDLDVFGLPKK
ncbi:MAG: hypothetical protein QME58_05605 [Bacteroidota bacterium]|nr:hypothetical protein [Bacteroidota bacterium]